MEDALNFQYYLAHVIGEKSLHSQSNRCIYSKRIISHLSAPWFGWFI